VYVSDISVAVNVKVNTTVVSAEIKS